MAWRYKKKLIGPITGTNGPGTPPCDCSYRVLLGNQDMLHRRWRSNVKAEGSNSEKDEIGSGNTFGGPRNRKNEKSCTATCVCMWSCSSSARSTMSTGNDSFTDHGFHEKHIKVEGFIWGVATKVACMLRSVNESMPVLILLRALLHMHKRVRHMPREGEGGAAKSAA
ncbi:hypothetical protein MSG28_009211 [Choristoneura fumiferana]|uniref:Uncharacterized protein n=1 Tax=Choristoneura fumiferana TaxID=7141 RepID=A0ACC0KWN5_CHOFU|nr:hypothetical protein MSG28_009211 [Choristoneura fumiferana]